MTARLYVVKKRRATGNPDPTCRNCGKPIEVGTPYVWFKFRYGGKQTYHDTPACRPTADQRESNEKRRAHSRATAAVETARTHTDEPQVAAEALREAIDAAQEIVDALDDSLSSWQGTNFEYGDMATSFQETKDELERWISEAETVAETLEGFDVEPEQPGDEPEQPDEDDYDMTDADGVAEFEEATNVYETDFEAWQTATDELESYEESVQRAIDDIEDVPELQF